mgnify:FL=1
MADYRTEFWRKHYLAGVARMRETGQEGPPPDLPIVIPVVVYHGDQHFGAVRLSEQWQAVIPDQLLRFFPDHEILLCDLHGLSDEEILAVGFDLLASVLLSLKHARDTNYLRKNFVKLLELGGQTPGTDLHPVFSLVDLFQYIVSLAGITEEEYNDMSRSFSPEFNQKHRP